MKNKFISASANIENMDEKAKEFPIVNLLSEINCVILTLIPTKVSF